MQTRFKCAFKDHYQCSTWLRWWWPKNRWQSSLFAANFSCNISKLLATLHLETPLSISFSQHRLFDVLLMILTIRHRAKPGNFVADFSSFFFLTAMQILFTLFDHLPASSSTCFNYYLIFALPECEKQSN